MRFCNKTAVVLLLLIGTAINYGYPSLESMSLAQLEKRLEANDAEIEQLSSYSLRSGFGSKGYISNKHSDARKLEWIQIDLGATYPINEIAVVPTILRDSKLGYVDECFPEAFSIIAGTEADKAGFTIASFDADNKLTPRIAPLVISNIDVTVSWIRIEATKLRPRAFEGLYFLQLAEIMVFSGQTNVALRKPVTVSSSLFTENKLWSKDYVVDGFVPYLMDSAKGEQSLAFLNKLLPDKKQIITIDLTESLPISQINLHAVEQNLTVPFNSAGDFGLPEHLIIEGANKRDFTDAITLVEYQRNSTADIGPIIQLPFSETHSRFVRFSANVPSTKPRHIGFAEIVILTRGRNAALGAPVTTNLISSSSLRSVSAITDGNNFYGKVLSTREWIIELARRHDIETERPLIVAELNKRYDRQRTNLNRAYWLLALLTGAIILIVLINRMANMRQLAAMKERFAADLHDELGANLHTIGLLSDLATEAKNDPEELDVVLSRIRDQTEKSGEAVRNCTNMLEVGNAKTKVPESIHRITNRVMRRLDHTVSIKGEVYLNKLKPKTRFDLILFYKECLINISRHSGATAFSTVLRATEKEINLVISDNGLGFSQQLTDHIPKSLKRRARLLGATVAVENSAAEGTKIMLNLKTRKWGRRK